jgi:hypothetical protein
VMCCSLWFLSLFGLKSIFNSPTQFPTYESRDWVMCCSFVIPFFTFGLRVFFNSPTQFLPMKQGLVMCCSFVISFLCVWS